MSISTGVTPPTLGQIGSAIKDWGFASAVSCKEGCVNISHKVVSWAHEFFPLMLNKLGTYISMAKMGFHVGFQHTVSHFFLHADLYTGVVVGAIVVLAMIGIVKAVSASKVADAAKKPASPPV